LNFAICVIKGNINSVRYYYSPGDKDYDRKRWFCTEAEAEAAGWRKPKPKH
jgi:hypothetical protein